MLLYNFLLDPDDLAFLMDHLQPIASRWKPFGLQLGLLPEELDTIAATPLLIPGGPVAYVQELLSRWLNHAPPFPSLTKLCDALRSPTVDQSRIAQALEQQYQTQKAGLSSQAVMINEKRKQWGWWSGLRIRTCIPHTLREVIAVWE